MAVAQIINFLSAFYARFHVDKLSPQEMDEALAAGYFRNGIEFCSISARHVNSKWASSVMLRLPIEGYLFKKRHRKILKTNNLRFTHQVGPFVYTPEKEALWQRFKTTVHKWGIVAQLENHLLRGNPATNYRMYDLCVYDQGKLVAFTAFDLGANSLASLEAAYDPEYADFSLGFYTMLLEIQYCQQHQLAFYYPGFYPRDISMFNYKLRPGGMTFFRLKTREWLPIESLNNDDWLFEEILDRLGLVKQLLAAINIHGIEGYAMGTSLPSSQPTISAYNVQLIVPILFDGQKFQLYITWDVMTSLYHVFEGTELMPALPSPPRAVHYYQQVSQQNYLGPFSRALEVSALVERLWDGN
jgi:leucyl-tRNA---protein transferase